MGNWSVKESKMSSTFRELRTTSLALQSFAPQLQGKEVLCRTDNKNTESFFPWAAAKLTFITRQWTSTSCAGHLTFA